MKIASRTKAMIAAVAVSLAGIGLIIPEPASAVGYYGKGYVLNVARVSHDSNPVNERFQGVGYYGGSYRSYGSRRSTPFWMNK